MSETPEPFRLRPERIGDTPAALHTDFALLSPSQAPDPREGAAPAIARILNGHAAEFILMTYTPGQVLADHLAAHPVTIQCLEGELALTVGGQTVALRPGRVAHLRAEAPHRVECRPEAPARNVLLLTMLTA